MTMNQELTFPSIRLKEEPGVLLLSVLFKSLNPRWGNNSSPIAKMVLDYFKYIPPNPNYLTVIQQFQTAHLSETNLYQLALTFNHQEREQFTLELLSRQTGLAQSVLAQYYQLLIGTLTDFQQTINASPLYQLFVNLNAKDTHQRLADLEELKQALKTAQQFFGLDFRASELIFTPSDPLFSEYIGHHLLLSTNQVVFLTNNNRLKTQLYQALRFLLEPLAEQLITSMSDEQRQKIYQLASGKVKQLYGPNPQVILLASLISVYYNQVHLQLPLDDYTQFHDKVHQLSDKKFLQSLETNHQLKQRCDYLQIRNLVEFKAGLRQYHQMFVQDQLNPVIFTAYKTYQQQATTINFEQFIISKLPNMI